MKNKGQAITEYILLLAILVSLFSLVMKTLGATDAITKLKKPLEKDFVNLYRYGINIPNVGDSSGTGIPLHHATENFRVFMNPAPK